MRILVTGARGLVGGPLCRRLAAAGNEVVGLDLPEFDVRDLHACEVAVAGFRPERVAHLAAWTDVDGAEIDPEGANSVNDSGTYNVTVACMQFDAAMLYVSTDYVFNGGKETPYRPDDVPNPLSVYGRSKYRGERYLPPMLLRHWIVRCQSIYGAGRKSFVDSILGAARAGVPLSVVADQRVQPSWCEDVAEAIAVVLLRAPFGVYHVANSGSCTWRECAQAALELAGLRVEVAAKTATQHAAERAAKGLKTATRPANSVFDCTKLTEATGHVMRPWRDALSAYLATRRPKGGAS
jgi:dTDP-4-dehydrorhamnose reductase